MKATERKNKTGGRRTSLRVTALLLLLTLTIPLLFGGCGGSTDPVSSEADSSSRTESQSPSSESETGSQTENIWTSSGAEIDPDTGVLSELSEIYQKNADVIGRISIPGTKLDLPVVQGSDNVYYLDHTVDKTYDPYGVPYIDYRARVQQDYRSENVTIYGHSNSDEGTYFAPVKLYKDTTLQYYKEHPIIEFDTIYGKGEYKVIAVMLVNTDIKSAELFNFHDYYDLTEEYFNAYIEKVRAHSYFENPDVDVKYGDQLLTLSTCDDEIVKSNTMPYRVALVARKTREGEKRDVDVSRVVANTDVIMPVAWIKKFGAANPFELQ